MCIGWTWYINADMQLFILSIFATFLYVKFNNKQISYNFQFFVILSTIIYSFIQCYINKFHTNGSYADFVNPNQNKYTLENYMRPWSRASPYFLGLLLGIYYFEYEQN
jgi:hypothetical protein